MMLRNRCLNAPKENVPKDNGPVKRPADSTKDVPKRRRGGLSDLSNVMSNTLLIDSTKKVADKSTKLGLVNRNVPKEKETKVFCGKIDSRGTIVRHFNDSDRLSPLPEIEQPHSNVEMDENVELNEAIDVDCDIDPCPEYDYDRENAFDPYSVHEYAEDIFKYYRHREKIFRLGDYSKKQPKFTPEMRAVLADWMVELQESFELNHETLYLAVKLMDHYAYNTKILLESKHYQLIAVTAIFIACKFDERCPPPIEDFLFLCEDAFSRHTLLSMERNMFATIGFDLGFPLSYRFLRRFSKVLHLDMATLTLARYYLETSLLFYDFMSVPDSLMAAACLLLALRCKQIGDWNDVLVKYAFYRREQVEPLMWAINHMMWMRPLIYPKLVTANSKYSHEIFYEVTRVPLLKDRYKASDPVKPPRNLSFTD